MYNTTAKGLAALGRNGDNTLMHVGKNELAGLQALLGHHLTVNPETGLHEAFSLQDILVPIGLGIFGALTGGAGAAALGMGGSGLTSAAIGAGSSGLVGGAINKSQGKDFGAGFFGGAVSGGMGGYGASSLGGGTTPTPSPATAPSPPPTTAPTAPIAAATGQQGAIPGLESLTKPTLPNSPIPRPEVPMTPTGVGTNPNNPNFIGPQGAGNTTASANPSFSDALGHTFSNMTTNQGMESMIKPLGYGAVLGGGVTSMMNQNATSAQQVRAEKLQNAVNDKQQSDYFNSMGFPLSSLSDINNPNSGAQQRGVNRLLWGQGGYAAGGSIEMRRTAGGVPMQTTIPPKFADTFENSDLNHALTTLDQRINTGKFATGGYINTTPMPEDPYPQSQIPKATSYPAAAPQRHEVVRGYEQGGFLDGPGDGMSDDIPANIDGAEDIRLADGEFVVPPEMVSLIGGGDPEEGKRLLDKLLPMVRQAAHGKKEQIKQDAGKLAAEKMVLRNTARRK